MTPPLQRQTARQSLNARIEAGDWERETLIETTVALDGFERDIVEDALEDLTEGGLCYLDNGEVKR